MSLSLVLTEVISKEGDKLEVYHLNYDDFFIAKLKGKNAQYFLKEDEALALQTFSYRLQQNGNISKPIGLYGRPAITNAEDLFEQPT